MRQTQTDSQTDRQTERERGRQTERDRERDRETERAKNENNILFKREDFFRENFHEMCHGILTCYCPCSLFITPENIQKLPGNIDSNGLAQTLLFLSYLLILNCI